jgi:uncharacterized protein related to proFAR isomerase
MPGYLSEFTLFQKVTVCPSQAVVIKLILNESDVRAVYAADIDAYFGLLLLA